MKKLLQLLHLTPNQSLVYQTLFHTNSLSITELSRRTNIKRTTLYSVIEILKQLGIVSELHQNGHRKYRAESPEVLKPIAQREQLKWQNISDSIEKLSLHFLDYQKSNDENHFKIYEGLKSIAHIEKDFFQQLQETRIGYQLGDLDGMYQIFGFDSFSKKYAKRRRQLIGSKLLILCNKTETTQKISNLEEYDFREIRFLPDSFHVNSTFMVCDNTIWLAQTRPPYYIIKIQNPEFADLFKAMWQFLWEQFKL